jgi:hypothetical protein
MAKTGPSRMDLLKIRVKRALGMNPVLCEKCKWNWRSACHRRERPKAVWCPDYSRKGS